jgi:hypothetical protein
MLLPALPNTQLPLGHCRQRGSIATCGIDIDNRVRCLQFARSSHANSPGYSTIGGIRMCNFPRKYRCICPSGEGWKLRSRQPPGVV